MKKLNLKTAIAKRFCFKPMPRVATKMNYVRALRGTV